MSNRYETVDDLPLRKSPLEPVPEPSRVKLVALIVGIVVAAGVGIATAFGLNLCPYVSAVGMKLEMCGAPAAPPVPDPAPLPASLPDAAP